MSLTLEDFSYSTFLSSMDYGVSTGSGFRLWADGSEYLITARHVFYNEVDKFRCDSFLCTSQNYKGDTVDARTIVIDLTRSEIEVFRDIDLVVVRLIEADNFEVQQIGSNVSPVDISDIARLTDVKIASEIIQVGFPSSLYFEGMKFFDINRPLLRKGIVAGVNLREGTFIIDCPAFYGNSGGPVIQISSGEIKIAGIVSRYIPFVTEWRNKHEKQFAREEFYNSGYAVCVPLDLVVDYVLTLASSK